MKMSIFIQLARASIVIDIKKALTWWRSGLRSTNCLDGGSNLEQYVYFSKVYSTRRKLLQKRKTTKKPCRNKTYMLL